MKSLKKSWVFAAIVLVSVIAAFVWLRSSRKATVLPVGKPQLVVQLGHSGRINSAAFSPDGRFIVSGGSDLAAILWETATSREIRRFVGHLDPVNSVAFSPDGQFVLTGSGGSDFPDNPANGDFTARLWDVATGKEIRKFGGHTAAINAVAFSPDGQLAATGSDDKTMRLWKTSDGTEIRLLEQKERVSSVTFSPDGRSVWSSNSDIARLWDVETGKELRRSRSGIGSMSFSPDGRLALAGTQGSVSVGFQSDSIVRLLDVATGKEIQRFKGCSPVAFSPNGQRIVTGCGNGPGGVQLFKKGGDGKDSYVKSHGGDVVESYGSVVAVGFSPNGESVFVVDGLISAGGNMGDMAGEISLRLYSVASGKEVQRFDSDTVWLPDDLTFSADGNFLLSGNGFWDVRAGNEIQLKGNSLDEYEDPSSPTAIVSARTFSKNGRFVLIPETTYGYGNEAIRLWDVTTEKEVFKVSGFAYIPATWFSPDNRFVFIFGQIERTSDYATALRNVPLGRAWSVSCWEIATRREVWCFNFRRDIWHHAVGQYPRANTDCALSPDGRLFAVRELAEFDESIDGIILLNAATGRVIRRLKIPTAMRFVSMLAFTPDSRFLLTNSPTGDNLSLYDIRNGKEVRRYQDTQQQEDLYSDVAFSPDGRFLAAGGRKVDKQQVVRLWEVATGKEIQKLQNQSAAPSAFSPDSHFLLTSDAGNGQTVHMWETATGNKVRSFEGHTGLITSIAVSLDNRLVLTGSTDGTERLWDISTGEELCRLVSLLNGDWVVTTPDGRFDSNNLENTEGLYWVIPDEPLRTLPLEIFMRQYYEPRLLARVMAGEKFKPLPSLAELNRTQPEVKIVNIAPDSAESVQVTVEVANVKSAAQQDTEGNLLESGVYDVRLFRDRQLVGYAPANDGKVELSAEGKATLKFPAIKWPRTGIEKAEFSAYAFNADRVKSTTDRKIYSLAPRPAPVRGRAYVISVGVNAYERESLNLRYAANDARQIQESVASRLAVQGEYEEVISVSLISDYAVELADGRQLTAQNATIREVREGRKSVTENRATKAHLRTVLDVLAGRQADATLLNDIVNADKLRPARPEDLVLISVSSHGYTDGDGIFYLVPSDTGVAPLSSPEFRSRCVSSDELSSWLRDVDAGELVLIVDACHSAAAVEGTDFKPGPMGSRGLGQLSYDKGMRVLTATQTDNVALETNKVRQGLLIYALTQDGLGAWKADYRPQNQVITLAEWLSYGAKHVPELYMEVKNGTLKSTVDSTARESDKIQHPSLFDFASRGKQIVLTRRP